jgi:hypothetical protein
MRLPWGNWALSGEKKVPGMTAAALLHLLRSGTVGIATFTYGGLKVAEVKLPITISENRLLVRNATGNIAQGVATADITYPLHQDSSTAQAKLTLHQVDSTTLVRDWIGKEVVRGPLSAEVDLRWEPRAAVSILEQMSGEGTLTLGEGVLLGVDLTDPAGGGADPSPVPGGSTVPSTTFTAGQATVAISQGMVELGEAAFSLADGKIDVFGVVDMTKQRVELETTTSTVATVVNKKGREEQQQRTISHTIIGAMATPEVSNRQGLLTTQANNRLNARKFLAEKMPPPTEEGLGPLVGKDLVDPAVVAERFGLQPELLRAGPMKKKHLLGTGHIRLGDLRQEETLR